jgi:hypothetical protein
MDACAMRNASATLPGTEPSVVHIWTTSPRVKAPSAGL